jgi:plastocyanin
MPKSPNPSTTEPSPQDRRPMSGLPRWWLFSRSMVLASALCLGLMFTGGLASPAGAATKSQTSVTITIQNFTFKPSHVTVKPGETIKVVNKDGVTHTLTSLTNKFNTGDIGSGKTKSFTAPKKAGHYPYHCEIHQFMTGTVTVS